MIAMIDYDAGNIRSVEKALMALGTQPILTRDPDRILEADGVILPGVGAFGDAMERLRGYGLLPAIYGTVERGVPFLGICLGLQLLFEESEESPGVRGLGILPGKICRIPQGEDKSGERLKVPQIGWNGLSFPREGRLFYGVPEGSYVYFVHSYYLKASDEGIVTATTRYGVDIHASVEWKNVFACQFHPEKSSAVGLRILENFISVVKEAQ